MTPVKKRAESALRTHRGEDKNEEQIKLLGLMEVVNEAVSSIMGANQPISLMTCKARIHKSGTISGERPGRYQLDKEEHDLLTANDGLYIFVVIWPCKAHRLLIIPARALPYQRQYSWYRVFDGGFINELQNEIRSGHKPNRKD